MSDPAFSTVMAPTRISIRNRAIYYASCIGVPAFMAVTWGAWQIGDWPVVAANVLGVVLVALTGLRARLPDPPAWFTYPVMLYLIGLFWYLMFSGYELGAGTAWMMLLPPLALLMMGSIAGLITIMVQIPVLVIGFFITDTIAEDVLATSVRARLLVAFLINALCCFAYAWATEQYDRSLREANARIRSLEQLLPMCAYCKNVRNEEQWASIETFLQVENDVRVSHSICPTCMDTHFPGRTEAAMQPPG